MRVFHHSLYAFWLNVLLSLGAGPVAWSQAGISPEKFHAVARDVTATPGAAELTQRHENLSDDEFPMRFQLLEAATVARWEKLDLTTRSRDLPTEVRDGLVTFTLPNGGQCFLRIASTKDAAAYELTFSSIDAGRATSVPVTKGNVLLLGSPQNNAHDANFVLIVITPPARR